jgi:hypothetical protein
MPNGRREIRVATSLRFEVRVNKSKRIANGMGA